MNDKADGMARAIAECPHVDFFNFDPLFKQERFVDLQKLASFWLLKEQILILIEAVDEEGLRSMEYNRAEWLLDKIKELDG